MNYNNLLHFYIFIIIAISNTNCLQFRENDFDPNSEFSQFLFLSRLINSKSDPFEGSQVTFDSRTLGGTPNGSGTLYVEWKPSSGATTYNLYISENESSFTNVEPIVTDELFAKVNNLKQNTMYYTKVLADNQNSSITTQAITSSTPYGTGLPVNALDISGLSGQGNQSGFSPSIIYNPLNQKILGITENANNTFYKPSLFDCDQNFTQCIHKDISGNAGNDSGANSSITLDLISQKLLVAAQNNGNSAKLSLFRCNLDGSNCNHYDLSTIAEAPNQTGYDPYIVINPFNRNIIVTARDIAENKLRGFFCSNDISTCEYKDLSAGQPANSGSAGSAVIDPINQKLLIATRNGADNNKLSIFRCDLDGSNCNHTNGASLVAQGNDSGWSPNLKIDIPNKKLMIVTRVGIPNSNPGLYRCDLDITNCTFSDLSFGTGSGPSAGFHPSVILDHIHDKILLASTNNVLNFRAVMFRCNLDGSNCEYSDLSVALSELGEETGYDTNIEINPSNGKVIVSAKSDLSSASRLIYFQR
ncbi:hypothetical protein [Leptospira sp. GIMC2001]|uniref:hypothetical protein n=1 Tax=Leptospira sp. GIMC2001 TaxID=1513297 RepID=UPI00234AEBE7|nr:hypothetical protein [Leptospira sp. GIMC2001]WCL48601.1 hypothetical protein O4O04_15000 [Leptospira sp. GIMC2001]